MLYKILDGANMRLNLDQRDLVTNSSVDDYKRWVKEPEIEEPDYIQIQTDLFNKMYYILKGGK